MKWFKVLLHVLSLALVAVLAFTAGFLFNEASKINEAREEKEAGRQLVRERFWKRISQLQVVSINAGFLNNLS